MVMYATCAKYHSNKSCCVLKHNEELRQDEASDATMEQVVTLQGILSS